MAKASCKVELLFRLASVGSAACYVGDMLKREEML